MFNEKCQKQCFMVRIAFPKVHSNFRMAYHTRSSWEPLSVGFPGCHRQATDLPMSPTLFAILAEHLGVNVALLDPVLRHPTAFGTHNAVDCPTPNGFCTGPGQSQQQQLLVDAHCVSNSRAVDGKCHDGLPAKHQNDGVAVPRSHQLQMMVQQQRNFLFGNKTK